MKRPARIKISGVTGWLTAAVWAGALLAFIHSGCERRQATGGEVARYAWGVVTRSDIAAFDEAWPLDLAPTNRVGGLLRQSLEQGLVPDDVGTYLASVYPYVYASQETTLDGGQPLSRMTDEDIARQIVLERVCLRRIRREPEQWESHHLHALIQPVHLFFQALEAGQDRFDPLEIEPEQVQKYYEEREDEFFIPASVDIRLLFLNTRLYHDRSQRKPEEAAKLAGQIRARLEQGERFGHLIRQMSDSGTRARGGWVLGVEPESLRAEVAEALAEMEPGQISPPIETPVGVHMVQLMEQHEGGQMPLEEVEGEIRRELLEDRRLEVYLEHVRQASQEWPMRIIEKHVNPEQPEYIVLTLGSRSYSLEELSEAMDGLAPGWRTRDKAAVVDLIRRVAHALLYLWGLEGQPLEHYQRLERRLNAQIIADTYVTALAEERLGEIIARENALRQFFVENAGDYRTPWKARISFVEIPLPEENRQDPIASYRKRQERVELARQLIHKLRQGEDHPKAGDYQIQHWRTLRKAQPFEEFSPAIRKALVAAAAENITKYDLPLLIEEPVEEEDRVLIVRVVEILPSRLMPFEQALAQVQSDFEKVRRGELIQQVREDLLREARFEVEIKN